MDRLGPKPCCTSDVPPSEKRKPLPNRSCSAAAMVLPSPSIGIGPAFMRTTRMPAATTARTTRAPVNLTQANTSRPRPTRCGGRWHVAPRGLRPCRRPIRRPSRLRFDQTASSAGKARTGSVMESPRGRLRPCRYPSPNVLLFRSKGRPRWRRASKRDRRHPISHCRIRTATPLRLDDFAGRPLVLYFYPKDDTSGCTAEALDFSALAERFRRGRRRRARRIS